MVRGRPAVVVALVTVLAVACTNAGSNGGAKPRSGARARPVLAFVEGAAEAANGTAVRANAVAACGSDHETYLAEILHTSPAAATVMQEWGDIAPGDKQVMVSGPVLTTHLGPTDLPMSHPYGDDLSMDVGLTPAQRPFSQQLGVAPGKERNDLIHVEISSGLIPHRRAPSVASAGETWREASDHDLTGFVDGFARPSVGDPALVTGRWIIDCGHDDYGTELHPMSFLAWSHRRGATNVVHAYMNPYRDTEYYSPDESVLGRVTSTSRFRAPDTKRFIPYLVDEIVRLISGSTDRLRSQELLEAVHAQPAPWVVCAPTESNRRLRVRYDVVTRPGVKVAIAPDEARGCATVTITITPAYAPLDAQLRNCVLPWAYLSKVATEAVHSNVDVLALIRGFLPPQLAARVATDPLTTCADPLAGPTVQSTPTGTHVRVDASQPFPFYGIVTVERGA